MVERKNGAIINVSSISGMMVNNVPESEFLQPVAVINVRNRLVECKMTKAFLHFLPNF